MKLTKRELEIIIQHFKKIKSRHPELKYIIADPDRLIPIGAGGYSVVYGLCDNERDCKYVLRITKNKKPYSNREEDIMDELKNNKAIIHYIDKFHVTIGVDFYSCLIEPYYMPLDKFLRGKSDQYDIEYAVLICNTFLPLLQELFDRGIFHRDIKFDNIFLVGNNGKYSGFILGDFGIASHIQSAEEGTLKLCAEEFSPPELWKNSNIDNKDYRYVDMFMLGCVMYTLLNQRDKPSLEYFPFSPPVGGTPELKNLVIKATSYRPENRFQSPNEMWDALEKTEEYQKWIKDKPWDTKPTPTPPKPEIRPDEGEPHVESSYRKTTYQNQSKQRRHKPPKKARRKIICPYCISEVLIKELKCECMNDRPHKSTLNFKKRVLLFRLANKNGKLLFKPKCKEKIRIDNKDNKFRYCNKEIGLWYYLCPECEQSKLENPYWIPAEYITKPCLPIAILGETSVGKTNYITIMMHELEAVFGVSVLKPSNKDYDEYKSCIYQEHKPITDKTVRKTDQEKYLPMMASIERTTESPKVLPFTISVYDGSGEDIRDSIKPQRVPKFLKYLKTAKGIIIALDWGQLTGITPPEKSNNTGSGTKLTPSSFINECKQSINTLLNNSEGQSIKIPVAFVFTKADIDSSLYSKISGWSNRNNLISNGVVNISNIDMIHKNIKSNILSKEYPEINNLIEGNFENYRFFLVSSFGRTPKFDGSLYTPISPIRVLDPIIWLMYENGLLQNN